jgi:hypothetical protein
MAVAGREWQRPWHSRPGPWCGQGAAVVWRGRLRAAGAVVRPLHGVGGCSWPGPWCGRLESGCG